jgi:muramoyltetrapeptide carboxypeptidase
MVAPPAIRPKDTVAICAPAGPVAADRVRAGVDLLASRYRVNVAPGTFARTGYLAGDDDSRAEELDALLRDPDVRAIILARGGYGLMRILDRLDPDPLRRDPKLIIGFSDATALLAWVQRHAGLRCIHGPMVGQLGELPDHDVAWLFGLMERTEPAGRLELELAPMGAPDLTGPIEGALVGGNLCMLAHSMGTPHGFDMAGAILLLEEVGERPYRIDRYLTHLGLAGVFDQEHGQVRGALVGEFLGCEETVHQDHPGAMEVVDERLRRYQIPALCNAPTGHGARNLALPLGARCVLDPRHRTLELIEAAVA